jgi:hypothetical protein
MVSRWIHAACLLVLAPASALAFEAVDSIDMPTRGGFGAYAPDPIYPVNLWVQAGAMWDSNPFGISDTTNVRQALGKDQKSDTVARLGVGANYTQRIYGRQTLRLGGRADAFKYVTYDQLDNIGYAVTADWLWELGNDFSGAVGYGRTFGLADLSEAQRATKDMISADRVYAQGAWRIGPSWRLRGDISRGYSDRSGDREGINASINSVVVGLDYVTTLANTIGVQWRESRGTAPVTPLIDPGGQFTSNEYKETEVDVVGSYNLGAQLRLGGTVGRAERSYTQLPVAPFDGPVWRVRADWLPGYKTVLTLEGYRAARAVLDVDATHVVVRGATFGPQWAPTAKLVFSARILQERRQYQQTDVPGLITRDETIRALRLGAGWEPRRHYSVTGALEYGERTSNQLGRDFNHVALMANFRYDW